MEIADTNFVKEHSDSKSKYTEDDIINMLEFLVDNMVGIQIGTDCAPLLADIFLYSYEAEFIQSLLSAERNSKHLTSTSYIDTSMTYCQFSELS